MVGKGGLPNIPKVDYDQLRSEVQEFRAIGDVTQDQVKKAKQVRFEVYVNV